MPSHGSRRRRASRFAVRDREGVRDFLRVEFFPGQRHRYGRARTSPLEYGAMAVASRLLRR